ncbi:hypothetical protein OC846_004444 [Tilletia horrida]|uniref:DUF423-domain-containing protein n=1 Tax=Tilletia horrida TaxID=155126 RepID=A0AAN6JQE1_9BASI|nr:hypothetical protein OC846_004444 [Tilletia horrida]KAK0550230.1 hypothetical protein OC845_002760 [Tilletia horrida]KAK0563666.1 hypothetical protein OC861_004687 [Tilletia horrida]
MPSPGFYHTFACVSGAVGVAAGAFGAHALKSKLTPHQLASWQTAVSYQLLHSVALLYASSSPGYAVASGAFSTGIALFSGSIYTLCLTQDGNPVRKLAGPITPLGGLAFIVGWAALAYRRGAGSPPRLS